MGIALAPGGQIAALLAPWLPGGQGGRGALCCGGENRPGAAGPVPWLPLVSLLSSGLHFPRCRMGEGVRSSLLEVKEVQGDHPAPGFSSLRCTAHRTRGWAAGGGVGAGGEALTCLQPPGHEWNAQPQAGPGDTLFLPQPSRQPCRKGRPGSQPSPGAGEVAEQ